MKQSLSGSRLKTVCFFAVLFTLAFLFCASLAPYMGISLDGGKTRVVFDLLLALSLSCGMICEDRRAISVIALVFGVLSDLFLTPAMHLSPLLFFLSAYFASTVAQVFTSVNAATAAVSSLPFLLIRAVTGGIFLMSENNGAALGYVVGRILLPEFALNVTAVFLTYLAVKFLYKRFRRRFYV